jgi:Lysylphosphatidylglycerol synthase TM region
MKKFNSALLVSGVVFLAWLIWKIGPRELWQELTQLGWGIAPFILSEGIMEFVHTIGWRRCLSGPLRSLPLTMLFQFRLAGYAINYLTPTAAIGGEVTKAALLTSKQRGPQAVSGVLIDKVCFAFAHVLFVSLGSVIIVWKFKLPRPLWVAMVLSGALVAVGMLVFMLLQKYGKLGVLVRWLVARKIGGRALERVADEVTAVDDAMKAFHREQPLDLVMAIVWHVLAYTVGIAQTWLFFKWLHQDASWAVAAGAWFLSMWFDLLTFAVPMNVGSLEGSRIVAFKAMGYDAVLGLTFGVATRLAQLFWSLIGLAIYGWLSSRTHEGEPSLPAVSSPANRQRTP